MSGLPRVLPLAVALACFGMSTAQDYKLSRSYVSAEYRNMVDSTEMFEASRLIMLGEAGHGRLRARLRSGEAEVVRATLLAMAYSGEARFLPDMLPFLDHEDYSLVGPATLAVTAHPKAAWPLLVRMARAGSVDATHQIGRYENMPRSMLEELFKHRKPEIRIAAMHRLGREFLYKGLDDSDWNVCRAAVRALIWDRSIREQLVFHRLGRVRAFSAELAQTWTIDDLSLWARVARDKNPEVRKWAMYHLAPLMMNWREPARAEGRKAAIEAVAAGIEDGPAKVRTAATHAVRSWALGWDEVRHLLPADDLSRVLKVFESRKLRDELVRQSQDDDYRNSGVQSMGIHMAHALVCLAITGDSRAHDLIIKRISLMRNDSMTHRYLLVALKYCGDRGKRTLHSMMDDVVQAARDGLGFNEVGSAAFDILIAVASIGDEQSYARLTGLALDRGEPSTIRRHLIDVIGRTMHGEYFETIRTIAEDRTEDVDVRFTAINSLAYCPQQEALTALEGLAKDPIERIVKYAQYSIGRWEENRNRR